MHVTVTTADIGGEPIENAPLVAEEMERWLRETEGFEGFLLLTGEGKGVGLAFWANREVAERHSHARAEFRERMLSIAERADRRRRRLRGRVRAFRAWLARGGPRVAELGVTPDRRRLIADALGRSPATILENDDGYDFEVAIVDDEWVFRFPRRAGVAEALEVEIVLLPALESTLPVAVPSFEYVSRDPLFVGYRLIRGEPLVDEDADSVRAFLEALHALDPSGLPVAGSDWIEAYRGQCAEFERLVLPHVDRDLRQQAIGFFGEAETLVGFQPALVHADLGPAHLLVRDGRLAGVIDWGDVRVGDPALDYSWLLNGPFADWDVDPDLRRRARFYHRLGPWYEAHYGLFTDQPAAVERGLAGIRDRL